MNRQIEEVDDIGWFSIEDAFKLITFDNEKNVLSEMIKK